MKNILQEICDNKLLEIAKAKNTMPFEELKKITLEKNYQPKGFFNSLLEKKLNKQPALIAEIKKKSPSKGIIRENFDPIAIANSYQKAGASCISVLTDERYFAGKNEYLQQVRNSVNLPIIRKDFILDEYQIYEAKYLGADCILLIIACLEEAQAMQLESVALSLGLDVLIEVHDEAELETALKMRSKMVGVNNRNLKTMEISLQNSINLAKKI
ncbi:MAG: indole-3-glycerol phosphate synthase TrpC, partial [Rickettsiales bacterium]|nr:indole-3-glycerol phosphate synthase TrpC [Rickettsiales bacterium]